MVEMPVPSVVMAATQTTATRDSSKPYSTSEAPSSSRANLVAAAVRGLVMEISPDGVDRVKGNKTPLTAQILPATVVSRLEMLVPSKAHCGLLKIRQLRARDFPPILFRLSTHWRPKPTRPQLDRRFGVWTPKCCPACS